jgi:hypothetical protein
VAKLQSAVLPRERVKKVVEMVWSDRRSTAEQGCGKKNNNITLVVALVFYAVCAWAHFLFR